MHSFIFSAGVWHGSGKITFSMAEDVLNFTMKWIVLPKEEHKIYFHQEVAVESFSEKMHNHFTLLPITATTFEIQLENQIIGKVVGSGLITPKTIAWEFRRKTQEFEGYEIYELSPNGYKMHAEFTAGENMRTRITGSISRD